MWESLVSDESIAAWGATLKSVTWTSPRPFGVGTTREVATPVGLRMRERYFLWEEGRRHAFAAYESTAQLLNRFAEEHNPSILSRSTGKAVIVSAFTTIAGFSDEPRWTSRAMTDFCVRVTMGVAHAAALVDLGGRRIRW